MIDLLTCPITSDELLNFFSEHSVSLVNVKEEDVAVFVEHLCHPAV